MLQTLPIESQAQGLGIRVAPAASSPRRAPGAEGWLGVISDLARPSLNYSQGTGFAHAMGVSLYSRATVNKASRNVMVRIAALSMNEMSVDLQERSGRPSAASFGGQPYTSFCASTLTLTSRGLDAEVDWLTLQTWGTT